MKKLSLIIPVIFFLTLTSFVSLKTAKKVRPLFGTEADYFWFSVRVTIREQKGIQIYKITSAGSGIQKGSLEDFEKAVWQGLAKRQIVVGAFKTVEEAKNAKLLYKSEEKKIKKRPKYEHTLYWFAIHFEESKRLRIYIIRRASGAIRSGDLNLFIKAFFEQLNYQMFTIGPFDDYNYAEDMKRLYRRNE